MEVAAVIKDVPSNSTFSFSYVLPFSYGVLTNDWFRGAMTNWDNNSFQTFVELEPNVSYAQMAPKIHEIVMKYDPEAWKVGKEDFFFHPMKDWHLYGDFKRGVVEGGFIDYVRLFSIIGVLVLLIACVNFMNLSTARSVKRAREVGVRKVMGSLRYDLIVQFLTESMMITLAAAFISLVFVQLTLPSFNTLTQSRIRIPWENPAFWGVMALYVLVTGLLAGSRPAFYLSGFQPVKVLKGVINVGRSATLPRKILVVLQFTCSIALIIGTMLIYQQVQYAKDRPSGYDSNRLVFSDGSDDVTKNYVALRSELLRSRLVDQVTRSSSPVTALWNWSIVQNWEGKGPDETLALAAVDIGDNYFNTMGMKFVAGRDFTGNYAADTSTVIINEAAAKKMRLKEPVVGQVITWRLTPHTIVGVVKDALMTSPYRSAEPTFFGYSRDEANDITYRLSAKVEPHDAMSKIASIFNKYNPAYPFSYHFVDESYADKFEQEVLIGRLSGIFAALAIFISCLGLFGLAAYMAEQRTREIGIRKVLGASVVQLWMLLSKDFLLLVLISCVVASPVAYYFLQGWLEKYKYRITIGPGVFLMAGAMALLITVLTISFQAIRGAMANPTKSLRSE
ncbi:MAG: ABC transporter permease [Bacteroidetes bacterium]|nr:ABC transporter permease [Bacteroidota bacterium]